MSLKTSATPDALLEVQQTGLEANSTEQIMTRWKTVSNFDSTFRPYLEELLKFRISTLDGSVSVIVDQISQTL